MTAPAPKERDTQEAAPRRRLDLTMLQRKNRQPTNEPAGESGYVKKSSPGAPSPVPNTSAAPAAEDTERTARISFYVPERLSRRAKAAFRATSFQAGDRTWSSFLVRALESEVVRRERDFNAGEQFRDSGENIPAGRPLM